MENTIPDIIDKMEAFQHYLRQLLVEYKKHQLQTLKKSTVNNHIQLINYFIGELMMYENVTELTQITVGMCGSKLVRSFNSNCGEAIQLKTAKNILHRFFSFVAEKEDIFIWPLLHNL